MHAIYLPCPPATTRAWTIYSLLIILSPPHIVPCRGCIYPVTALDPKTLSPYHSPLLLSLLHTSWRRRSSTSLDVGFPSSTPLLRRASLLPQSYPNVRHTPPIPTNSCLPSRTLSDTAVAWVITYCILKTKTHTQYWHIRILICIY